MINNKDKAVKCFKMSIAELTLSTNELINIISKNLSAFERFGVTQSKIDELQQLNDEVKSQTQDKYFVGEVGAAVEARNIVRERIEQQLRYISLIAKSVFRRKAASANALSCKGISRLSDYELLLNAGFVYNEAFIKLEALAGEGLTADFLNELQSNLSEFEIAIHLVETKKDERSLAAEERINKANELYELVVKYAAYGRFLFSRESAAIYSVFVINHKYRAFPKQPENLRFSEELSEMYWDDVKDASSYTVESSIDGENFSTFYKGKASSSKIHPVVRQKYFRVKARNSRGYGKMSEVLHLPSNSSSVNDYGDKRRA